MSDNPTISCPILEVPVKGFGSTWDETVIWKPVKKGSYAKVAPEQKYSCVRGKQAVEHDVAATNHVLLGKTHVAIQEYG